jgi:phosphoglycolate phosphatase-like HAD superfamily hydrolase
VKIKAVLFDMDGTLVDSFSFFLGALNQLAKKYKFKSVELHEVEQYKHLSPKEIMKEMTEVFFSGTFGGELISLSAANAVLNMHIAKKVVPKIIGHGSNIASITNEIIKSHNLSNTLELKGHDSWKILSWASTENYSSDQIRTLFLQEMFEHGVLVTGSHNVSTALTRPNIEKIWQAYDKTLETISNAILNNNLEKKLKTKPLVPLFKVR